MRKLTLIALAAAALGFSANAMAATSFTAQVQRSAQHPNVMVGGQGMPATGAVEGTVGSYSSMLSDTAVSYDQMFSSDPNQQRMFVGGN